VKVLPGFFLLLKQRMSGLWMRRQTFQQTSEVCFDSDASEVFVRMGSIMSVNNGGFLLYR